MTRFPKLDDIAQMLGSLNMYVTYRKPAMLRARPHITT